MYSVIILFNKISTSIWEKKSCLLELWQYAGINHECDKIEHYVTRVPNNFLNKECKNKINYTRHIFEKKKKERDQFPNSKLGD